MSLKISNPEKKKPRAMPVETIVTRFKSKQKLLEKEQQNVTNNVKKQKTNKKSISNARKNIQQLKKTDVAEKNEIYPNKLRRKIVNKKIVLVPRHSYKVIGRIKGCNKRKLKIPQKEISILQQRINLNSSNELKSKQTDISITEMVKILEDNKSLDDEDLLEILTCPSPVWWEDPPDGYVEEAIFSRPQPKFEQKSVKTQLLEEKKREEQEKIEKKTEEESSQKIEVKIPSMEINVTNRDKTFIKKRSKLELLLGNILKSKENKQIEIPKSENSEDSAMLKSNSAISKSNSAISKSNSAVRKIKMKRIQKSQNIKRKLKPNSINKERLKEKKFKSNKKSKLVRKTKKKRDSDSFKLSDIEDDILEHLENMDIPIEDNTTNLNLEEEKEEKKEEVKEKKEKDRRISIESNKSDKNLCDEAEYLDMSVFDELLENKMADSNEVLQNKMADPNEVEFNEVSNTKENTEYVTVYKIINNEINNDINELKIILPVALKNDKSKENGGKINDYYKQCKKINLPKGQELGKNNDSLPKINDKSILISESDSVRYCLLCSSIFDKETCDYCEKKGLKRKKFVYVCDFCGFKVNNKQDLVKHLVEHQ